MNLKEFIVAFNALGPEYLWTVDESGNVRATHSDFSVPICPVIAVFHSHTGFQKSFNSASNTLPLTLKDGNCVANAADDRGTWWWWSTERRLRKEMLLKVQSAVA